MNPYGCKDFYTKGSEKFVEKNKTKSSDLWYNIY